MSKKATIRDMYNDFKSRNPNNRYDVIDYDSYDKDSILLYFSNNREGVYNYRTKSFRLI